MTWHRLYPREQPKQQLYPRCPRCELPTLPQMTACRWCGQLLAIDPCGHDMATVPADCEIDAAGGGD